MNATQTASFETILKKMYGEDLEYQNPYEGSKGSYPAEIFYWNGIPLVLFDKIKLLSLKMIGDREISTSSDHDVIASTCGYRGGVIQLIFTKTKAFEIFERTIRQEYDGYMQREEQTSLSFSQTHLADKYNIYKDNGPISAQQLCSKIPALKELITGSRYGFPYGQDGPVELLAKSKDNLEEAEKIIKNVFKEHDYNKNYVGHIRIEKNKGLEVLCISYSALSDLKTILTNL